MSRVECRVARGVEMSLSGLEKFGVYQRAGNCSMWLSQTWMSLRRNRYVTGWFLRECKMSSPSTRDPRHPL